MKKRNLEETIAHYDRLMEYYNGRQTKLEEFGNENKKKKSRASKSI